jgi:2-phosphoglycerate kinase
LDRTRRTPRSTVYWIGGATDSGKTSVARELARRHRSPVYHYDEHDARHHRRLAEKSADYAAFLDQTLDERWIIPSPEDLARRAWQSFHDRFPLVLEDLTMLSLPEGMPIIAEGFGLTAGLVAPLLARRTEFVCLIPADDFKAASMKRREKGRFGDQVSDPHRAMENLRQRDRLIAERLRSEAKALDMDVFDIDGTMSISALATRLGLRFGLS